MKQLWLFKKLCQMCSEMSHDLFYLWNKNYFTALFASESPNKFNNNFIKYCIV